jgi:hypothetical protein
MSSHWGRSINAISLALVGPHITLADTVYVLHAFQKKSKNGIDREMREEPDQ